MENTDTNHKEGDTTMKNSGSKGGEAFSATRLIDEQIAELGDWRGEMLSRIRRLIKEAGPEVVEKWKWGRGGPVWLHAGTICTAETHKTFVRIIFLRGAFIEDPSELFNSSLEGNAGRVIDFHEGDKIEEEALKALVRAAVALNNSHPATLRTDQGPGSRGSPAAPHH
jgi:hypothetical protein